MVAALALCLAGLFVSVTAWSIGHDAVHRAVADWSLLAACVAAVWLSMEWLPDDLF